MRCRSCHAVYPLPTPIPQENPKEPAISGSAFFWNALLFTRALRDDATWPFSRDELVELDLRTLATEVLATEDWGLGADYDRSGGHAAVAGKVVEADYANWTTHPNNPAAKTAAE